MTFAVNVDVVLEVLDVVVVVVVVEDVEEVVVLVVVVVVVIVDSDNASKVFIVKVCSKVGPSTPPATRCSWNTLPNAIGS